MTRPAAGWRGDRLRGMALALWVLVAIVIWNGLYDVRIAFGVREYLLQAAMSEAGRGPAVSLPQQMAVTVRESVTFATFWAALVLAAGLVTVHLLRPGRSR